MSNHRVSSGRLLVVVLAACLSCQVAGVPADAGDTVPAGAAGVTAPMGSPQESSPSDPPVSPLRVMIPTDEVAAQLLAEGYGNLAEVITAMDPVAAYSPGPRMPILDMLGRRSLAGGARAPTAFRTLAILVDFSDESSQVSASFFDTLVFGTATPKTVHGFYDEASYGLLDIVTLDLPSGMGWQRAPQSLAYYTAGNYCEDAPYPHNCRKLAEDVTALVNPVVDFSDYDNDGDGWVDTVFIIHAGLGAERTGNPNDIWSHSWWTYTQPMYDGVWVGSYTIEPEYYETPGDMTHGVYVHELGHALGLPDLYDYGYDSAGVGNWSLMSGGAWNGTLGDSPAQFDAWSRVYLGFNDTVNVSGIDQAISLPNVMNNQAGSIYRLGGANSSEYWLLENRQLLGSDAALPGAGLLIWHVDQAATSNDHECHQASNWLCAGASNHFHVALEQADGLYELENNHDEGNAGDPFPGTANKRVFNFASNPNSSSYYTSSDLGVAVSQISNSATTMTAVVSYPASVPNDDFGAATSIGSAPFTASQDVATATTAGDDPLLACSPPTGQRSRSVWYRYTPPSVQTVTVDTLDSDYDTVLGVWTGSRGSLTSVACNDDDDAFVLQSAVEFAATAGTTYYIDPTMHIVRNLFMSM